MKKLLCLVCCSLFLFSGCGDTSYFEVTASDNDEGESVLEEGVDATSETDVIFVQVAGAVRYPGVYQLSGNSRVFQAIDSAGGLLDEADDSDINMALSVNDGEKIYVYTKEERLEALEKAENDLTQEVDDGLVNINTATAAELQSLPGIGASKANMIVTYRENNGNFSSVEEIKNVSGIGDGIYAQIQLLIKV